MMRERAQQTATTATEQGAAVAGVPSASAANGISVNAASAPSSDAANAVSAKTAGMPSTDAVGVTSGDVVNEVSDDVANTAPAETVSAPSAGTASWTETSCAGIAVRSLPALRRDAPSLVLLHGLGFSSAVWEPLFDDLRRDFHLIAPDLPGFGASAAVPPAGQTDFLTPLLPALPERALYLGWSLGGMLALELAARCPQRVSAVIAVGANPCFQQRNGWQAGAPPEELQKFREIASQDWNTVRRRLAALIARGEPEPRALERQLQKMSAAAPPSAAGMQAGLQWLGEADLRAAVRDLEPPTLYILGREDALVPAPPLAQSLRALPGRRRIALLDGTGHAPFLSQPQATLALLRCFAEDRGLLPASAPTVLDRRRVRRSFGGAAASYDGAADLQREVGAALIELLRESVPDAAGVRQALDLGCGTGACLPHLAQLCPQAQLLALDMAEPMLHRAQARFAAAQAVCADAERLPLAVQSIDLVFANLCFQWCAPQQALAEVRRVLRLGGRLAFSAFVGETLWELRSAWRAMDERVHAHRLPQPEDWRRAAADNGLDWEARELRSHCRRYANLRALALELKSLGARNGAQDAGGGLSSPRRWRRMEALYARLGSAGRLPATFEVLSGVLRKTS